MTATIELTSSRRKLQVALGDRSADYFAQMKLWFRKLISKEDFDAEARRLLSPDSSHIHNEFLLAILNKCQTLANFAPSVSTSSMPAPSPRMSGGSRPSPAPMQPFSTADLLSPRKYKYSDSSRLRCGKNKRSKQAGPPDLSQRFQPSVLNNSAPDGDQVQFFANEERALLYCYRESPTLPDTSLVHGRVLVTAWEEGLEGGAEDEAVKLVLVAIHQLLQRMVSALLMSRNGYKMHDNSVPHSIGSSVPNPWLLNTQRKLRPSDPWLHEVSECAQQQEGSFVGDVDPLVPLAPLPLVDVEQKALLETACALDHHADSHHQCDKAKRSISLFDLLKVLKEQKSLIPSHSVYAINMERLYTKLYHKGHDD